MVPSISCGGTRCVTSICIPRSGLVYSLVGSCPILAASQIFLSLSLMAQENRKLPRIKDSKSLANS